MGKYPMDPRVGKIEAMIERMLYYVHIKVPYKGTHVWKLIKYYDAREYEYAGKEVARIVLELEPQGYYYGEEGNVYITDKCIDGQETSVPAKMPIGMELIKTKLRQAKVDPVVRRLRREAKTR